jgi:hypothetical protein
MKLGFTRQIFDKLMKFVSLGAKLLHVDGQTSMTELSAAFRNLVKAPKELYILRV